MIMYRFESEWSDQPIREASMPKSINDDDLLLVSWDKPMNLFGLLVAHSDIFLAQEDEDAKPAQIIKWMIIWMFFIVLLLLEAQIVDMCYFFAERQDGLSRKYSSLYPIVKVIRPVVHVFRDHFQINGYLGSV